MLHSVELFAGGGGLTLGLCRAGFHPSLIVEKDTWSCKTLLDNQALGFPLSDSWRVVQDDVRNVDYSSVDQNVDLVSGGPPCQPFSVGGKHAAYNDSRDMFPAAVEAVRKLRPRAFLFENVRGLTRKAFAPYLRYIELQLTYPDATRWPGESWEKHLKKLEAHDSIDSTDGVKYRVNIQLVNAADYGVPQQRFRVFFVGFRCDEDIHWAFPSATHSETELLKSQWLEGSYWDTCKVPRAQRPSMNARLEKKLLSLDRNPDLFGTAKKPWRTIREALKGLPALSENEKSSSQVAGHIYQGGAKAYPGHTGSPIDLPSKALKAGDHGVPGGENMMVFPDQSVRYFSVREAARIQTFPDTYLFHGSWTETMRQLGNAVPVNLAFTVGKSIANALLDSSEAKIQTQILENNDSIQSAGQKQPGRKRCVSAA